MKQQVYVKPAMQVTEFSSAPMMQDVSGQQQAVSSKSASVDVSFEDEDW